MLKLKPRRTEMPPFEVRSNLEKQEKNGKPQKELDAGIETRLHGGVLQLSAAIGVGIGFSGGDTALHGGYEPPQCRREGGQATCGAVCFEEKNPCELLRVFASSFSFVS